jgi:hypothetical protein
MLASRLVCVGVGVCLVLKQGVFGVSWCVLVLFWCVLVLSWWSHSYTVHQVHSQYACFKDPEWVRPGQVFWSACAHRSRDPNPSVVCRYITIALFVCIIIKELVKVGIVLFMLVRRKGIVPPSMRGSSWLVVVIAPVGIGSHSHRNRTYK